MTGVSVKLKVSAESNGSPNLDLYTSSEPVCITFTFNIERPDHIEYIS